MAKPESGGVIDRLTRARLAGAALDLDELPGSVDAAQQLQIQVLEALESSGQRVSGWKLGLTSGRAYDLMGAGVRPFGYLLEERTFRSGASLRRLQGPDFSVEPEICLEVGRRLAGPEVSLEECRAAVTSVRASFEINQSRVPMPGRNHLFIADDLSNWGLVVGAGQVPAQAPLRPVVELRRDGHTVQTSSPDLLMDDPFVSLATLCRRLSQFGRAVDAGRYVIVGAFFRYPIDVPGDYLATFEGLGDVRLTVLGAGEAASDRGRIE